MDGIWNTARERARESPDALAVWTAQGDTTFGDLFRHAEALEAELDRVGAPTFGVVGLALPNSPLLISSLLALRRRGCTVALISPLYEASELQAISREVELRAMLSSRSLMRRMAPALEPLRIEDVPSHATPQPLALACLRMPATFVTEPPSYLALVKFSSGSTGVPKGIALTERNIAAEAANIVATLGLTHDDRILATVPLSHSYGFDLGILAMLFSGAGLMLPDFFVPRRISTDLREHDVSVFLGVPDLYRRWLETEGPELPSLPRLRYALSCTAPLDADLIRQFHARFGLVVCQHYGSSETGAVATHAPEDVLARPESVGRPMRDVEVRILAPGGEPVARGEEGEIVVRSQAVAAAYVMGASDGEALRAGTFRTGDVGVIDQDGFLYVRGRRDQIINIGGLKVSPAEVKAVLERCPAVHEAAVVGLSTPEGEPGIAAAVTLRSAATVAEISAFCYGQLAAYKVPHRIDIRDQLPRSATGKIRLRAEDFER